jgi:hypothetical protein
VSSRIGLVLRLLLLLFHSVHKKTPQRAYEKELRIFPQHHTFNHHMVTIEMNENVQGARARVSLPSKGFRLAPPTPALHFFTPHT